MTVWTSTAIDAALRDDVWLPPGTPFVQSADFDLVCYPESFASPTQAIVRGWATPIRGLIEQVEAQARSWGRERVSWWVGDDAPPDVEATLADAGRLESTVALLVCDLSVGLPEITVPADVEVRIADTLATVVDGEKISATVWGTPALGEDDLIRILGTCRAELAERFGVHAVAYRVGEPAASANATITGEVVRLWAGATLPEHRHAGCYRALLRERLRVASEFGATLAVVKGRVETSAPILTRLGFSAHGAQRCYSLPVKPSPAFSQ